MKRLMILISVLFLSTQTVPATQYTQAVIDVTSMSIAEIQAKVDEGLITYVQIMQIYLDRIAAYEGQYNAIITLNEQALEQAAQMDAEYQNTGRRSLMHGLPILVKDNIDVVGMPTTAGTSALAESYPNSNATIVQRLLDAGAIVIAKTNMSEFALYAHSSYSSYGHTYNAYDTDYSSYGSSGGSAVGTAANFAVAAIGTDTGSSIRLPSAVNNLVGMRPTFGSIPMDGIIGFDPTRDVAGPITRYVTDNAIILDIISDGDTSYYDNLSVQSLEGVRIGVVSNFMHVNSSATTLALGPTNADVVSLTNEAIAVLESLGAEIVHMDNFFVSSYYFYGDGFCNAFDQYLQNTTGPIRSLRQLVASGGWVSDMSGYVSDCSVDYTTTSAYQAAISATNRFITATDARFESYDVDVVVYTALKTKTFTISQIWNTIYSTSYAIAPMGGYPAMTVPIGTIDDMPYGLEILARHSDESLIYQVALNYEQATQYYENPDIAPALYDIPSQLSTLIAYYQTGYTEEEYLPVYEAIAAFWAEYGSVAYVEARIAALIADFDAAAELIENNQLETAQRLAQQERIFWAARILAGAALPVAVLTVWIRKIKKKASL